MKYLILAFTLCIFWFLLSGHTSILLLTLGLLSVILVSWFINRMDKRDNAPVQMFFSVEMLSYFRWLTWEVIVTNIDVARRIWDPSLPIKAQSRKIKVNLKDPLIKTIYANSITLTPGTVTTEVGDDYFIVHALNANSLDELEEGDMERRLMALEESR